MRFLLILVAVLAAAGAAAMAWLPKTESSGASSDAIVHTVTRGELIVSVTEQGTLESSNNVEIKCRVRGDSVITSVVESGTVVQPGDVLVQLETLAIDEEISERTKFYHLAESGAARSAADVARAKLAIKEYEQGQYVSSLASLEKQLAVAESRLLNATNREKHAKMMRRSEFASELEVEEKEFSVEQAKLNVELTKTQIEVLKDFTKKEQLVRLNGELRAAEATHKANVERAFADKKRLERAQEELGFCTIKADRPGMVIYPTGEEWKEAPDIEEGATVHKDQILLLMPDLKQMQVKVGIHESIVDRVKPGMLANVTLNKTTVVGEVTYVAAVAKPASWWTGTAVKYDVVVELPEMDGLKPGMSVEAEIMIATHDDVVTVPTTAVMETADGFASWVTDGNSVKRRSVTPGDSNEMFLQIQDGLEAGEQVILDPLASVKEAQLEAAQSVREAEDRVPGFEDL